MTKKQDEAEAAADKKGLDGPRRVAFLMAKRTGRPVLEPEPDPKKPAKK